MSMFFEILKSINNPNQQGSVDQLGSIMQTVQQLGSGNGLDANTIQQVISSLGSQVAPGLAKEAVGGGLNLENIIGQVAGGGSAMSALSSFLTPELQQQILQGISTKTGLDSGTLQTLLPKLLPVVMGLLNFGANKSGGGGVNSVLTAFLDSNSDGQTDLGDVIKFAGRFLNPA